jgi:chromosome partitioning protein
MADLLGAIKEIKEGQTYNFFVLKNLYEQRNTQTNRYIHEQLKSLSDNTFTTTIRKNEAINQAQITSLPIQVFNPSSKGAQDFNLLTEEVIHYA